MPLPNAACEQAFVVSPSPLAGQLEGLHFGPVVHMLHVCICIHFCVLNEPSYFHLWEHLAA